MSTKALEGMVKKQSALLEEKMPSLLSAHLGRYVAFFDGMIIPGETHQACFDKAEKQFGPAKGFVVEKVSSQVAMVSALIKLK